jgi:hypothetical protein
MPLTPFADGPGNVASGVAVYNNDLYLEGLANGKEAAFSSYRRLARMAGQIGSLAAGTYLMAHQVPGPNITVNTANATTHAHLLDLDPGLYTAGARVVKYNLKLDVITNAVAPAITYTAGLYPILTYGGASTQGPIIVTIGTVVAVSQAAVASPGAAARTAAASGDFTAPASGAYVIAVATSGTAATGEVAEFVTYLEMRQV